MGWYFRKKFQISYEDTFPQIMIGDILQFPIPEPNKVQNDELSALVETMLSLHEQKAATSDPSEREIAETDAQIDRLVYGLYELTEEEIRIVEESVS